MGKKIGYFNKIKLKIFLVGFVVFNLFVTSNHALCAQTLSRDKATVLIEKNMSSFKSNVRLHREGYDKGLHHGMWVMIDKAASITTQGAAYFESINYSTDDWGNFVVQVAGADSGSVTLKNPANLRVKVTGIREGSTAEFTWEYVGLPSVVKRYVVKGGAGTAQFTLYDDGWRLANINAQYSNEPAVLTAKESREDGMETARFIQRETERQIQIDREVLKWSEMITNAMVPTEQLVHFKCATAPTTDTFLYILDTGIVLDTHYSYKHKEPEPDGPRTAFHAGNVADYRWIFWFGDHRIADYGIVVSDIKSNHSGVGQLVPIWGLRIIKGPHTFWFETEAEANKVAEIIKKAYERWSDKNKDAISALNQPPSKIFLEVLKERKERFLSAS